MPVYDVINLCHPRSQRGGHSHLLEDLPVDDEAAVLQMGAQIRYLQREEVLLQQHGEHLQVSPAVRATKIISVSSRGLASYTHATVVLKTHSEPKMSLSSFSKHGVVNATID